MVVHEISPAGTWSSLTRCGGLRQSQTVFFFFFFFFLLYDERSSIPDWARGKTLAKILDRQYGGPNPLNPDKIFPEFFTCNLEHIFNTKKSKWDRNSRCGRDYDILRIKYIVL